MSEHLQKFLGAMARGGIGWEDRYEREMCGGGSTSVDYARLAGHYISLLNEVIGAVGLPRLQVLIEAMDDVRRPDLLNELHNWSITYGRALCPTGADTYGDGVRACKEQVAAILRGAPRRRVPDGTPGVRDQDATCAEFEPGRPAGDLCEGDGHYLCDECANRRPHDEVEP